MLFVQLENRESEKGAFCERENKIESELSTQLHQCCLFLSFSFLIQNAEEFFFEGQKRLDAALLYIEINIFIATY